MATITLYSGKINQMSSLINKAKTSVKSYKSDLKSLKSKVLSIDESICDVDDVISSIKSSTKTQEDKIETLENLKQDINDFISDVVRIDGDAADAINKSKDDFYDKYEYLKPECEKSGWEKFKPGTKQRTTPVITTAIARISFQCSWHHSPTFLQPSLNFSQPLCSGFELAWLWNFNRIIERCFERRSDRWTIKLGVRRFILGGL